MNAWRLLLRYNIVTERETADALLRADAYLALQPTQPESEKGQGRAGSQRTRTHQGAECSSHK